MPSISGLEEDFFPPKRPREKKKTGISAHALSEYYAIDKTFFFPFTKGGQGPTM